MSPGALLALASVMLLGAMSPGPDFVLVVRRALLSGRSAGALTALGVAAGVWVWVVAAVTGIAAVLAVSATLYAVVKVLGGAYLVYLGVRAVLAARRGGGTDAADGDAAGAEGWAAFRQGLLCNVLNPKAAVFFVALLPQFMPPGTGPAGAVLVCVVAPGVTAGWFLLVALLVGTFRRLLARPRVRRGIDAVSGTALVLVGVRVVAAARVA